MRCTTPMPLYILPKMVCLLSSQGVGFRVIKNWLHHEFKKDTGFGDTAIEFCIDDLKLDENDLRLDKLCR